MLRSARCLGAVLLVTACAPRGPSPGAAPTIQLTIESLAADSIAHAMVQRALEGDARLVTPDSLYIAEAEVLANGAPRADAPRFAGIREDGQVQLGSSRFAVTGSYVWGTIQYRWVPSDATRKMAEGWATFVIARLKSGEWRILHVHSSTATPEP